MKTSETLIFFFLKERKVSQRNVSGGNITQKLSDVTYKTVSITKDVRYSTFLHDLVGD